LTQRFSQIELIEHIVMPNHIHGIIAFAGVPLVGTRKTIGDSPNRAGTRPWAGTRPAPTAAGLGDIVGAFKSITTHEYIRGVRQHGWEPFPGKLWQRNYYENIVRNDNELIRIREYIKNNPAKWVMDRENPFPKINPT
jgi:REP element-mobilizing transposase RayT